MRLLLRAIAKRRSGSSSTAKRFIAAAAAPRRGRQRTEVDERRHSDVGERIGALQGCLTKIGKIMIAAVVFFQQQGFLLFLSSIGQMTDINAITDI
eukprot:6208274-Pleurochrysis_carterae.AAC.2